MKNNEFNDIKKIEKIEFIKEELNWFIENEPKILDFYKQKFSDSVKKMVNLNYFKSFFYKDNPQILKSLEFFNELGNNFMITEIKNFSNKTLKDVMIEKLYKKIIIGKVNNIKIAEFTLENFKTIRNELNEFFNELIKQTKIMKNLGNLIHVFFDKISLNSFDDIMETVNKKLNKGIFFFVKIF